MLISVIFSFRNEEDVLLELIRRTTTTLEEAHLDYELLFINDASNDSSLDILLDHRRKNPKIKIITMSRRFGVAPCIMAGIRLAKGDAVVHLDADLQDPPELVPEMVKKVVQGADVVHTVRTERHGESAAKMWLTSRAYRIINAVADIHLPENAGDFKMYSRRAADAIGALEEYDPYMRGLARWVGFEQVMIYYERDPRFAGETKFSLLRSINPFKEFIRGVVSFSDVPLYLALIMGFIVSMGAFVYLIYIIISKVFFGLHEPGMPALMAIMLSIGGVILFTNGMIGIYIGKIFNNVKRRPSYIIQDTYGVDVAQNEPPRRHQAE